MSENYKFPLSDLQRWLEYDPNCSDESLNQIIQLLGDENTALELACAGLRPVFFEKDPRKGRLVDTFTGFYFDRGPVGWWLDPFHRTSYQDDILRVIEYRSKLRNDATHPVPPMFGGLELSPDLVGGINKYLDRLDPGVVEYEAERMTDLQRIINEIENKLNGFPKFRKLWFRGQVKSFSDPRPMAINPKLGLYPASLRVPSLLPSLARRAHERQQDVKLSRVVAGPGNAWKKGYFMWIIRNNPQWLERFPEWKAKYEAAFHHEDYGVWKSLLHSMTYAVACPDEIDDLRQWFELYDRHAEWVWMLQQYGYIASLLDLTWDLDTALFFAESQVKNGKFSLSEPKDGRVIYIFAESTDNHTFIDPDKYLWGHDDWKCEIPQRIIAQRAGGLQGAHNRQENLYGHLIVAQITLYGSECRTRRSVDEVFPLPKNDTLLNTLLDTRPIPEGLYLGSLEMSVDDPA